MGCESLVWLVSDLDSWKTQPTKSSFLRFRNSVIREIQPVCSSRLADCKCRIRLGVFAVIPQSNEINACLVSILKRPFSFDICLAGWEQLISKIDENQNKLKTLRKASEINEWCVCKKYWRLISDQIDKNCLFSAYFTRRRVGNYYSQLQHINCTW